MAHTTNPDCMTFNDRLTDVAAILAAGMLRERKRRMGLTQTTRPFDKAQDRSFSALGLDVSQDVSIHWNEPDAKGPSTGSGQGGGR
jgi:hypothetical protein